MTGIQWLFVVYLLLGQQFPTSAAARNGHSISRSFDMLVAQRQTFNFAWVSMSFPLNRVDNLKDVYRIYNLASSIRRHSVHPIVVLTDLANLEPRASFHEDMQGLGVKFHPMVHLNMSKRLRSQIDRYPSWIGAYQKLQVFNLTEYDRLVWLDSDAMITRKMDHLFQLQGYWAPGDDWALQDCVDLDRKDLKVNSGLLAIKPSPEHFKGLLAKGEEIASHGTLYMGDQEVIETYFKDIGQPVQILEQEDAGYGSCWAQTPERPLPGFVHTPLGYESCLDALSEITHKKQTDKMPDCSGNILGCMYHTSMCDANISDDIAAETFCSSTCKSQHSSSNSIVDSKCMGQSLILVVLVMLFS